MKAIFNIIFVLFFFFYQPHPIKVKITWIVLARLYTFSVFFSSDTSIGYISDSRFVCVILIWYDFR